MVFRLKVSLAGIKGFYRVYLVNGATTLYTLHKQLRYDLEFPQDQLIVFKALDATEAVLGRYGLFDLGSGTVDQISLEKAVKAGAVKLIYFYDVNNRKSVIVSVEGEEPAARVSPDTPQLIDTKGPNPIEFENGYVAYEDLPDEQRHLPGERSADGLGDLDDEDLEDDEEEEEEEEEEEDDEDGKEIYDENE